MLFDVPTVAVDVADELEVAVDVLDIAEVVGVAEATVKIPSGLPLCCPEEPPAPESAPPCPPALILNSGAPRNNNDCQFSLSHNINGPKEGTPVTRRASNRNNESEGLTKKCNKPTTRVRMELNYLFGCIEALWAGTAQPRGSAGGFALIERVWIIKFW